MDAGASCKRQRHGDLLEGVLQVAAGSLELADEVGTMQQLEGGRLVGGQPGFQDPADLLARHGGVEIGGAGAKRFEISPGGGALVVTAIWAGRLAATDPPCWLGGWTELAAQSPYEILRLPGERHHVLLGRMALDRAYRPAPRPRLWAGSRCANVITGKANCAAGQSFT